MTLAILLYALAGGALAAAGAWALATVFRMARQPERWVWATGMAVAALLSVAPFLVTEPGDSRAAAPAGASRISERPAAGSDAADNRSGALRRIVAGLDAGARIPLAREVWLALSATLLIGTGAAELRHRRKSGAFRRVRLHGVDAWQSRDQGPAVWGALRPRLVLPARIGELSPDDQRLVVAHEAEHLSAHDPQLNAAMALLLVLVPWNPFLWFMAGRLARAIESDCDRRTLARCRAAPRAYAELLLRVASWQRTPATAPLALAMGRSARELQSRLVRVLHPTPPRRAGTVAGVVLLAVGAAAPLLADPPDAKEAAPEISEQVAEPAGAIYRAREVPATTRPEL